MLSSLDCQGEKKQQKADGRSRGRQRHSIFNLMSHLSLPLVGVTLLENENAK